MGEYAKETAPALAASLKDPHYLVRDLAAIALSSMGEHAIDAVPVIVSLLKDPDSSFRSSALKALGNIGKHAEVKVPVIIALLEDSVNGVRISAIEALGKMGEQAKEAVPEITALLKDTVDYVRRSAAEILGEMGEHDITITCFLINKMYFKNDDEKNRNRFIAHLTAGNRQDSHQLINLAGEPCKPSVFVNAEKRVNAINILYKGWRISDSCNLIGLKNEIEERIKGIAYQMSGIKKELECLKEMPCKLKNDVRFFSSIEKVINKPIIR